VGPLPIPIRPPGDAHTMNSAISKITIATCTVTFDGYHRCSKIPQRLSYLRAACYELASRQVSLVILPGGYLFGSSPGQIDDLRQEVQTLACNYFLYIAVGIDAIQGNPISSDEAVRRGRLPPFVCVARPDGSSALWRQRSQTSRDQRFISDSMCWKPRLLLPEPRIEALVCGEIFNPRIREGLASRSTRVAVDLGHYSGGFRVHAGMKSLAKLGISSLCSVHADRKGAMKYCYAATSDGIKRFSSRKCDLEVGQKPWVEFKFWEVRKARDGWRCTPSRGRR